GLTFFSEKQHGATPLAHQLYWSVILLGFMGFVLVLLNAHKVQELLLLNNTRKKDLDLLENRLQAMEASLDGIAIIASTGKISFMNKAMYALHGLNKNKDDVIETLWYNLYNEKGRHDIQAIALPVLERTGHWHG